MKYETLTKLANHTKASEFKTVNAVNVFHELLLHYEMAVADLYRVQHCGTCLYDRSCKKQKESASKCSGYVWQGENT